MRKKRERRVPVGGILPVRSLFFKLCVLAVFVLPGLALLAEERDQEHRIDISVKEVTIVKFLKHIRSKMAVEFLYNVLELEKKGTVTLEMKDASLDEILKAAFEGKDLTYSLVDGVFVIKPVFTPGKVKKYLIQGKVLDEEGVPMPGVTIALDSTRFGTVTDNKGLFSILLPADRGTLLFSFIGYQTVKLKFKYEKDKAIVVKMKVMISNLDEVAVVAYGETTKREMTGAVSIVRADEIKGIPSPNISNLLQGRVAGMDVTNVSGAPGGGGTSVTIRGYNSLSVENGRRFSNPLWVVDGVPMNAFTSPVTGTNGLSDLNPETIESIQILKDASATSLYGSRAANGVIIVTTKKGKKNQSAQFDVNFSYTYSILPEYPVVYGGKGERDFRLRGLRNYRMGDSKYVDGYSSVAYPKTYEEAWYYGFGFGSIDYFWRNAYSSAQGGVLQDSMNVFFNNSTNFFKYYFRPGKIYNANIQTNGGSEMITYSVGLGYYKEDGILRSTGYNRVNLMGNFNFTPVKRLSVDFRTYLTVSNRSRGPQSGSNSEIETIPGDPLSLSTLYPGNSVIVDDILKDLRLVQEKNTTYRLRNTFGVGVDIVQGLKLTANLSIDYGQNNRNNFIPSKLTTMKESESQGEIARDMTVLNENLLTFKRTFHGAHTFDVMMGFSYQYDESNYMAGYGQNGPSDMVHYVGDKGWPSHIIRDNGQVNVLKNYSSDFTQKKMASYFGRLNYNYKQRYLLTATLRRDGSSVFGRDHRWATFPSAALAWNFSEESFMRWIPGLDFGKLRVSYGVSGNQFYSPYLAYGVLEGSSIYDGQPTLQPEWTTGFYNPKLGWEETKQLDVGFDLNFMNYRLQITMDYYNRLTRDMLYKVVLPGSHTGYNLQWRNAAKVENQGVEFEIKYDIFRKNSLRWKISANIAKNWNVFKGTYNNRDLKSTVQGQNDIVIGKSVGSIYGFKTDGYIQSDEEVKWYFDPSGRKLAVGMTGNPYCYHAPGDLKFIDINGDNEISFKDESYLGSSIPKVYGGIVNELSWKNFDLNMLWSFSLGRDMVNMMKTNSLVTKTDNTMTPIFVDLNKVTFWEKEGDDSTYPILAADNYNGSWASVIDRYVEQVNYLKLKTLTIGYSLPKTWLDRCFLKDVRFFFSGENLLTLTNYSGMDPETVDINTGLDEGKNYPLARKLTVGITIKL